MTKNRKQHAAPCWPREWVLWPAGRRATFAAAVLLSVIPRGVVFGQDAATTPPLPAETTEQKVQRLTAAVASTQAQMDAYQKQLQEMQNELSALQKELAAEKGAVVAPPSTPSATASTSAPSASAATLEDIRERQALQESQIATHEQTKGRDGIEISAEGERTIALQRLREHASGGCPGGPDLRPVGFGQYRIVLATDRSRPGCAWSSPLRGNQPCGCTGRFLCQRGAIQLRRRRTAAVAHSTCRTQVAEHRGLHPTGPQFSRTVRTFLARCRGAAGFFLERKSLGMESPDRPLSPDWCCGLEAMEP